LLRLPAPGLRGTFAKAYTLITLLVSKIGWDELLKTRSAVFVMEEEYRLHKNTTNELDATDDASTTAIRSPAEPSTQPNTPSDIPTIRISSESDRVRPNGKHEPVLEKPELAQANENPGSPMPMTANGEEVVSAFSNKRLCERWLDNLFL
jgi:hypothetical protein